MKGAPKPSAQLTPDRVREEALFEAARGLAPDQRDDYLRRVCGENAPLRQRLEKLLQANEQAGEFLESATWQAAAKPTQSPLPVGGATAAGDVEPTLVAASPISEKPGDVIGRYKIREKLGEGGCGVVYVAEQTEPVHRRVALKIIKLGMDTRSVIARFEAERQALAMMEHPNIAKVLDAGATELGRPFFVMELVRGIKITDYCDQNNLSTSQRLNLVIQVCHAIQHAHQKGVIHRDIKPSNILVTLHDGVPVPKVIDFGIAKATEGRLTDLTVYTELHQFIGTPAYMSPEQAEMSGLDIDTRSDIYSLGVLLYELLTGRTPFDPQELLQSGLEVMRRTIREKEPLRPSTRLSTMLDADLTSVARRHGAEPPRLIHLIRGDLDWIVMKALEKDRTRRFETASALAADVQRFLKNEPIEARPPSNFYRLQKLVRRNQTTFAASAAFVVALMLGLGLSIYLYVQERAASHRAIAAEKQQAALREQAEKGLAIERRLREMAPIADKLNAAGYLLSQGLFNKAEELMSTLPPVVPQSWSIYNVIAEQHVRQGEWSAAITNFMRSVTVDPTNHLGYHPLAPLLIQSGDVEGYKQLRQRILHQFGTTSNPTVAERMAKDCLILPPDAADLPALAAMADTAVKAGAGASDWGYYEFAKGFAEYRQGHFSGAVDWLQKVVPQAEQDSSAVRVVAACTVQSYMILAMAHSQLKHSDEARAMLNKGELFANARMTNPTDGTWGDQIIARLLMREARTLISDPSNVSGQTK